MKGLVTMGIDENCSETYRWPFLWPFWVSKPLLDIPAVAAVVGTSESFACGIEVIMTWTSTHKTTPLPFGTMIGVIDINVSRSSFFLLSENYITFFSRLSLLHSLRLLPLFPLKFYTKHLWNQFLRFTSFYFYWLFLTFLYFTSCDD